MAASSVVQDADAHVVLVAYAGTDLLLRHGVSVRLRPSESTTMAEAKQLVCTQIRNATLERERAIWGDGNDVVGDEGEGADEASSVAGKRSASTAPSIASSTSAARSAMHQPPSCGVAQQKSRWFYDIFGRDASALHFFTLTGTELTSRQQLFRCAQRPYGSLDPGIVVSSSTFFIPRTVSHRTQGKGMPGESRFASLLCEAQRERLEWVHPHLRHSSQGIARSGSNSGSSRHVAPVEREEETEARADAAAAAAVAAAAGDSLKNGAVAEKHSQTSAFLPASGAAAPSDRTVGVVADEELSQQQQQWQRQQATRTSQQTLDGGGAAGPPDVPRETARAPEVTQRYVWASQLRQWAAAAAVPSSPLAVHAHDALPSPGPPTHHYFSSSSPPTASVAQRISSPPDASPSYFVQYYYNTNNSREELPGPPAAVPAIVEPQGPRSSLVGDAPSRRVSPSPRICRAAKANVSEEGCADDNGTGGTTFQMRPRSASVGDGGPLLYDGDGGQNHAVGRLVLDNSEEQSDFFVHGATDSAQQLHRRGYAGESDSLSASPARSAHATPSSVVSSRRPSLDASLTPQRRVVAAAGQQQLRTGIPTTNPGGSEVAPSPPAGFAAAQHVPSARRRVGGHPVASPANAIGTPIVEHEDVAAAVQARRKGLVLRQQTTYVAEAFKFDMEVLMATRFFALSTYNATRRHYERGAHNSSSSSASGVDQSTLWFIDPIVAAAAAHLEQFLIHPCTPLRLFIAGPPCSGKSIALYITVSQLLLPHVAERGWWDTLFVVPVDWLVLLGSGVSDAAVFFCKFAHHVLDCLLPHRPSLRTIGTAMVSFWKKCVTQREPPPIPPSVAAELDEGSTVAWRMLAHRLHQSYLERGMAAFADAVFELPILVRDTFGFDTLLYISDNFEMLHGAHGTVRDWRASSPAPAAAAAAAAPPMPRASASSDGRSSPSSVHNTAGTRLFDLRQAVVAHWQAPRVSFVATAATVASPPPPFDSVTQHVLCSVLPLRGLVRTQDVLGAGLPRKIVCRGGGGDGAKRAVRAASPGGDGEGEAIFEVDVFGGFPGFTAKYANFVTELRRSSILFDFGAAAQDVVTVEEPAVGTMLHKLHDALGALAAEAGESEAQSEDNGG